MNVQKYNHSNGSSVSVAMCTYNGEKYLREQLDSILHQSHLPDELIVSDDASSDNTLRLLKSYKKTAPFKVNILENISNIGYVKNFEKVISHCKGDYIFLCDQDDVWYRDKIESIVKVFEVKNDIGYVFTDASLIDIDGNNIGVLWSHFGLDNECMKLFNNDVINQVDVLMRENIVTGATMAIRKKYLSNMLPFPAQPHAFVHDRWLAINMSLRGWKGFAITEPLLSYRQHNQQQIGVRKLSFLSRLKQKFRFYDVGRFSKKITELEELLACVNVVGIKNSEAQYLLSKYTSHNKNRLRALTSSNVVDGMKIIFTEVFEGGYKKYSKSWRTWIKDFLSVLYYSIVRGM